MDQTLDFETALKQLEQIVNNLENGNLSLKDSMKYYEDGVLLAEHCKKLLHDAEAKVTLLSQSDHEVPVEIPFGEEEQ